MSENKCLKILLFNSSCFIILYAKNTSRHAVSDPGLASLYLYNQNVRQHIALFYS